LHASISDIVLDCFQNSIEAGATSIKLTFIEDFDTLKVEIEDDGCGMDAEQLKICSDPYYTQEGKHRNRKVGLGLPFLFQMVEQTEGFIELRSELGKGTFLGFSTDSTHLDMPPIGDIAVMLLSCFIFDGDYELVFNRVFESKNSKKITYQLKRSELLEVLGSFSDIENLALLKSFIKSQEDEIIKE